MDVKSFYHFLRRIYRVWTHAFYDTSRFIKHSSVCRMNSKEKLMGKILWDTHIIEKGACLENPRLFYGKDTILRLIEEIDSYLLQGGKSEDDVVQMAAGILSEYFVFMRTNADDLLWNKNQAWMDRISSFIKDFQIDQELGMGGKMEMTKSAFQEGGRSVFPDLCQSRYSTRNFTGEPIPLDDLKTVLDWARKSPSVCNRQCVRAMLLTQKNDIHDALTLQEGARGFGESVGALIIIGADLNAFILDSEKNQNYIDSGFFAMNVLYGLHYMGYGACPLHWFWGPDHDIPLRKRFDIPESWNITLMIAVGVLPDSFSIPIGHRRPVEDILVTR